MAIKAYCINLDRRKDRWQEVSGQFAMHGLDVERIPAIDAKEHPETLTPVRAFTLSHYSVIAKAIDEQLSSVLVFEDDVILHDDFNELLAASLKDLPDNWDMLYLGGTHRQSPVPVTAQLYKVSHTLTTHAYILRNTMYNTVMKELWRTKDPADCVYAGLQKEYNCYVTNPPLAWQRGGFSDIEGRVMHYPWLQTNEQ